MPGIPHLGFDWLTVLLIVVVGLILLIPIVGHHYANALKLISDGVGQGLDNAAKTCGAWADGVWAFCIDHVTPYSEKQRAKVDAVGDQDPPGPATGNMAAATTAAYAPSQTNRFRPVSYPGGNGTGGYTGNGYTGNGYTGNGYTGNGYTGNGYTGGHTNGNGGQTLQTEDAPFLRDQQSPYATIPTPPPANGFRPGYAPNDYNDQANDKVPEVPVTGQAAPLPDPVEPEKPKSDRHVVELIFSELLFLFLTMTVILSDFVFTAERINTVLFHNAAGINLGPLNFFRDLGAGLSGVLIAGIALLGAAIAFDVSGLIPEGAQLFPHISKAQRRVLLTVAALLMILGVIVSAFLGYLGQQLLDQARVIFPAYEAITIISLLVALFLALSLTPWAIMRGAAGLGVIVALPVILVLKFVGWVFGFVGNVIRVVGDLGGNMLIEIYNLFHQDKVETAPRISGRLAIVGMGRSASTFATELAQEVQPLASPGYLTAAGVYTADPHTYQAAHRQLQLAKVGGTASHQAHDISVQPADHRPVARLFNHISDRFHATGAAMGNTAPPGMLLWVIDVGEKTPEGELLDLAVQQMRAWQHPDNRSMRGVRVSVVALVPRNVTGAHTAALNKLEQLITATEPANMLTVEPSFLVLRDNAEASGKLGPSVKHLFTKSLAATIGATRQPDNQGLGDMLDELRHRGFTFAGLSTTSGGVVATRPVAGVRGWFGRMGGYESKPFVDDVTGKTKQLAEKVLRGDGVNSVLSAPDLSSRPVAAICLAPLPAESPESDRYKHLMRVWFASPPDKLPAVHNVSLLVGNAAEGVDISGQDPAEFGDRYCQVTAIYGLPNVDAALQYIDPAEAGAQPAPQWGQKRNI
ncbi:MAG TPA: hypothetical protein VF807_11625 [Ktedonobacterales bacterium]